MRQENFPVSFLKAEDETRTRDPQLGKLMLYQLSYFRIVVLKMSIGFLAYCHQFLPG